MPDETPTVSVIVVNWNRRELLERCLGSLAKQTLQDFETIVVDNGSSDGSVEMLADGRFGRLRTIVNGENRGYCAANNQGIAAARGRYVALLNNDAEAEPAWLAELVRALEAHPDAGMAASKILLFENPRVIDKIGHLIYFDGQNRGRGTGETDRGQYDGLEYAAWPDGCAAIYRADMLRQIGGFDEDFFAYADDAELGLRARIAGWTCLCVPTAVVRHHVGATLGRYSEKRLFLIERNRIWLAAKLFPWPLLLLNPFYYGVRMTATAAAAALGRGELSQAAAQTGVLKIIRCVLRANFAAWAGLPRIWRKRRQVERIGKLSAPEVIALLRQYRMPLRGLVGSSRAKRGPGDA